MRMRPKLAFAAVLLSTVILSVPASAQYRHWGHRHGGWGWGGAAIGGFAAGALLGSALTAPRYYGSPGYYDYGPEVYASPGPDADAVAYCQQRFRSYDPASGTYLGYDGVRHPCP
ncbi:MAG TPA: BA14K family protein [Pseudolabrys sp.]|nr:BA14K family protein [Pseudolabrys sp.]